MHPDDEKREQLIQTLRRLEAGFAGELRSDRFLERAFFKGPVRIFTNVELEITPFNFIQMDTIVMTPNFICILEVKNIKGDLYFQQNPPCLQRVLDTGEDLIIDCPVSQLEKNITDFDLWLEMNKFPFKSIGALVLAFTSSIVKKSPTSMPIFYAKELPLYLRKKESGPHIMSTNQFEKLSEKLLKNSRPFNPIPLCNYFNIDPTALMSGLFCHVCRQKMSRRNAKSWHCIHCGKYYPNPMAHNLADWFLLIKDSITVEECRHFLDLKNKNAARYALQSSKMLYKKGDSVATKYYYPLQKT